MLGESAERRGWVSSRPYINAVSPVLKVVRQVRRDKAWIPDDEQVFCVVLFASCGSPVRSLKPSSGG